MLTAQNVEVLTGSKNLSPSGLVSNVVPRPLSRLVFPFVTVLSLRSKVVPPNVPAPLQRVVRPTVSCERVAVLFEVKV